MRSPPASPTPRAPAASATRTPTTPPRPRSAGSACPTTSSARSRSCSAPAARSSAGRSCWSTAAGWPDDPFPVTGPPGRRAAHRGVLMTTTDPAPPAAPVRPGFPDPYAIPTPDGAEGWRDMYPYFNLFLAARRAKDSARTWFRNGMHFPEPMPPFDVVTSDSAFMSTGVMNTRVFALPPALGIDVRVLNGYVYMSANGVEDPAEIGRRAGEFAVRVGHYYRNWPEL